MTTTTLWTPSPTPPAPVAPAVTATAEVDCRGASPETPVVLWAPGGVQVSGAKVDTPSTLFEIAPVKTPPASRTRKPKNQGVKHSDHFQTPPEAILPLLPFLTKDLIVWEPACGKGNLVRAFKSHGYDCFGTDLLTGHDFLTMDAPRPYDVIVTNPPFTVKDGVIARCYEIGKPWALLLPLTALEGQFRQYLYRKHGVQVLVMPKRVNFETPNDAGSSSWFPTMWVTHGLRLPSDLTFVGLPDA